MYTQEDPLFKSHVKKLIEMTIQVRGWNEYWFRTEEYEDQNDLLNSEWITCGHCSKKVSMKDETKWLSTGFIQFLDNVKFTKCCGSSVDKELCPLVCVSCKRPAAYLTPHSNPTGFTYIPRKSYHLDTCSECCGKEGLKSLILEQVVHNNLNKAKKFDNRALKK